MTNNENLKYVIAMATKVIPNSEISPERMTVRQFCKEYVRITNSKRKPIEFSTIVTDALVSNNIQPSIMVNGNPYYSKYDFKAILEENPIVATDYEHEDAHMDKHDSAIAIASDNLEELLSNYKQMKPQNIKSNFLSTSKWKDFRKSMKEISRVDYLTNKPLLKGWNLHHMDLNPNHYEDISNPNHFKCLNKTSHEFVHWLFRYEDWREVLKRMAIVMEEMEGLNP